MSSFLDLAIGLALDGLGRDDMLPAVNSLHSILYGSGLPCFPRVLHAF